MWFTFNRSDCSSEFKPSLIAFTPMTYPPKTLKRANQNGNCPTLFTLIQSQQGQKKKERKKRMSKSSGAVFLARAQRAMFSFPS